MIGWQCGRLLPNDNDSARHRTDTADHSSSALSKKKSAGWVGVLDVPLDGNGSQRKESEQNRKEKNRDTQLRAIGYLMRIDTEQPGGWRHMVCLSQRHRASLVRGTAYVLRNCTTSLINSIPSQISPTTVLTCKAVPHCVYLHFLTSIEE